MFLRLFLVFTFVPIIEVWLGRGLEQKLRAGSFVIGRR